MITIMLRIIPAKPKDINAIDEIYIEGANDESKLQFPKKRISKRIFDSVKEERRNGFLKGIKNKENNVWVLGVIDSNIIAIGHVERMKENHWRIEKVYVKKEHRRKGYGREMLKFLINACRSKGAKSAESAAYYKNTPSIRMHESAGFERISIKFWKDFKEK